MPGLPILVVTAALFGTIPAVASAFEFSGTKQIFLTDESGTKHAVATITFSQVGEKATYEIDWMDNAFEEHFLSMRPFKCLEGETKYWCRVPYPYDIKRMVSSGDLTDLEYDLLFIWKDATEYGINMWNGVYYPLEIDGDRLVGRLNEMDMGRLGAPPEDGNLRPIREVDLEESDPSSHWLPGIEIR